MKNSLKMPAVALCGLVTVIANTTPVSAEEIFVDANGIKWAATCDRCVQNGNHAVISVNPQDVIVFRQKDISAPHGVRARNSDEAAKIRKREEDENASQIVEELGTGPTKIGRESDMKFPKIEDGAAPVEMTRIKVKDNFTGSLRLMCNVHGPAMQVTLKKD